MPFDGPHKLLTFGGGLFNQLEQWSCGLRFSGSAPPTTPMITSCANALSTWFAAVPPNHANIHTLNWVKLAVIGADGKYPPGTDALDYLYSGLGVQGANSSATLLPPQCCVVISLTTAIPRGRAHMGRMFMPPPGYPLTNGGIGSGVAPGLLTAVRTLITTLNGITDMGSATVKSKFGNSATITGLKCGLVVDTMRSRRRSIPENPVSLAL